MTSNRTWAGWSRALGLVFVFLCVSSVMAEDSIVPQTSWISDSETRWELARQLSSLPGREAEALELYDILLKSDSARPEWSRERLGLLQRAGRTQESEGLLAELLGKTPDDPELQYLQAGLWSGQGRAAASKQLFEKLERRLKDSGENGELRKKVVLTHAREMRSWGDFYRSEKALFEEMSEHPDDLDLRLDWIGVLRASQRWEEAEAQYRLFLLDHPGEIRALRGLADTRLDKKEYEGVLETSALILKQNPADKVALRMQALALGKLGRQEQALAAWRQLRQTDGGRLDSWIGEGRLWRENGSYEKARRAFLEAIRVDGTSVEAKLLAAMPERVPLPEEKPPYEPPAAGSPMEEIQWGMIMAGEGYFDGAIKAYQRALQGAPDYFPAKMSLIEVLGAGHQYEEALLELERLEGQFPENFKILLTRARIQSWARKYDGSLGTYGVLMELNPDDPVPRREAARVASWDKRRELSAELYAGLWKRPVDERLLSETAVQKESFFTHLRGLAGPDCPYRAYEAFVKEMRSPGQKRMALEYSAAYREQKSAWLENRAKQQSWDRRFARAEATYRELVIFVPGNQEAYFDLSQVQAALGLYGRAVANYEKLLSLDPLHNLAGRSLERELLRTRPAFGVTYSYWDEEGRGGLSDIIRHRQRSRVEVPLGHQASVSVFHELWIEQPERGRETFWAEGASVEAEGVLNEWLRGSAGITGKSYYADELADTLTGHARIGINAMDWAQFSFGYSRRDVINNGFALRQGTQSDTAELGLHSAFNHWVDMEIRSELTRYDDGNQGVWAQAVPALLLIDHPNTLKLRGIFDYRDVRTESFYVFQGTSLQNILYPYWSPKDYLRAQMELEWRQDLSKDFYHGAELHYYALRLRGGTDTTDNPSVAAEVEWHCEFAERWMLEIKGTLEQSEEWDGQSLWISSRYRF